MLLPEEIAEEYECPGYDVLTPLGFRAVKKVYKTVPLPVWVVTTETFSLRCSGHHIVMVPGCGETLVEELQPGDYIATQIGGQEVRSVTCTGEEEELYDITIAGDWPYFYTDGILSHNSTTFAARHLMWSHLFSAYRSLYIVPKTEHVSTHTKRYAEMENAFRSHVGQQNVYNKRYATASTIEFKVCDMSAEKIRGKTVDEVCIDEAQNMCPDHMNEILETQTTSLTPSVIYAGTALSVDTLLELQWSRSSQGMWHVLSGNGKDYLNMYDSETLLKVCDNPRGPICPYTNKPLDVTRGFYEHANSHALAIGNVGYHIPQVIVPDIAYDHTRWLKVYKKIKEWPLHKIMQECFGIAVAEGTREITEADLAALCNLSESKEEMLEKRKNGYYRLVVSGCDWGGSDYNAATKTKTSYTVHCILGLAPNNCIEVLHYRRYSGMDYPDIADCIIADHNKWGAEAMGSDYGAGAVYTMLLRNKINPNMHFAMQYSGPNTSPLASANSDLTNHLMLNKTESMTNLFLDIKGYTNVHIRCRKWEEMSTYLLDFLNIYRTPTDNPGGASGFLYNRVASKPDDALHALNFASILIKFFMGEPLVKDIGLENKLRSAFKLEQLHPSGMATAMYEDAMEPVGMFDDFEDSSNWWDSI